MVAAGENHTASNNESPQTASTQDNLILEREIPLAIMLSSFTRG